MAIILLLMMVGWLINFMYFKPFTLQLFLERYFLEYGKVHPEYFSTYGRYRIFNLGKHHARLDGIDQQTEAVYQESVAKNLELLYSYSFDHLDDEEQLYHKTISHFLNTNMIELGVTRDLEPVIDYYHGSHVAVPKFLVSVHQIERLRDAQNYISRMEQLAERLEQKAQELEEAALNQTLPSKPVLQRVIRQLEEKVKHEMKESTLYIDFSEKMFLADRLSSLAKDELMYDFKLIYTESLHPSYQKLLATCQKVYPEASENTGAINIRPDDSEIGKQYYKMLSVKYLTKEISQIYYALSMLQADLVEQQDRAVSLLQSMGYTLANHDNYAQYLHDLLLIPDYQYGRKGKATISPLHEIEILTEKAQKFSTKISSHEIDEKVYLKIMPTFFEPYSQRCFYQEGTLDHSRKVSFFFDPNTGYPISKFALPAMVCAELYPGHHYQKNIQQQNEELPTMLKTLSFVAFEEGWKIYALDWAYANGFFDSDLEKLAAIQYRLLCAQRGIADLLLHADGLPVSEVARELEATTGITPEQAEAETWMVLARPAFFPAYVEGLTALNEMKRECRQRLGADFDERAFHDLVLGNGSLPLDVLRGEVLNWLNTKLMRKGQEQLASWPSGH